MAMALAFLEVGGLFAALTLALAGTSGLAGQAPWAQGPGQALFLAVSWGLTLHFFGLYDLRSVRSWAALAPRLALSLFVTMGLMAVALLILPRATSTNPLVYAVPLVIVALALPTRALVFLLLQRPPFVQRVLLLGHGPLAERVRLEVDRSRGYSIVGVLAAPTLRMPGSDTSFRGLDPVLERSITELHPDVIVLALAERRGQLPIRSLFGARLNGTQIAEGTTFYESVAQKMAIENLAPSNLIFCSELTKTRWRLTLHRAVSVVVAALAFLLCAPLMALIALLIKLESEGPVFFVQSRVGVGGQPFELLKFRTMKGRPSPKNDVWHRDDTARITRLGRFLRRTRLDELPQLINILRGHMNLVGPRPEMADNVGSMNEQIPYYPVRHTIRPGVTGWAQVRQGYAVSKEEVLEKTCYDLYYIKHMSLGFDLRILLDTAKIVFLRQGT